MSEKSSWRATKRLVYQRGQGCCEYCQTCEDNTGQPMHTEHIDPDGGDEPDNLCLACSSCNLIKGIATTGHDPETGETIPLFNPRQQVWGKHFEWIKDGIELRGLTPVGRATIQRLKLNQQRFRRARANWMRAGNHPPSFTTPTPDDEQG